MLLKQVLSDLIEIWQNDYQLSHFEQYLEIMVGQLTF